MIREIPKSTPAVSPMVAIKQRGGIITCIDAIDVNNNVHRRHYPLQTLKEIVAKITGSTGFTKLDCKKEYWQMKLSERA